MVHYHQKKFMNGGSPPTLHLPLGDIITYMCEQHLEIVGRYMMDSVNVILVE
jgi:hypothetical protein